MFFYKVLSLTPNVKLIIQHRESVEKDMGSVVSLGTIGAVLSLVCVCNQAHVSSSQ